MGTKQAKTFVRGTVEALYKDIERDQITGVEQTIIDYEALPASDSRNDRHVLRLEHKT